MAGLFAAAFLRRSGWDVDVFERSPVELVGRGAGITTHPELLEALELSGAGTRDLGVDACGTVASQRFRFQDEDRAALADHEAVAAAIEGPRSCLRLLVAARQGP